MGFLRLTEKKLTFLIILGFTFGFLNFFALTFAFTYSERVEVKLKKVSLYDTKKDEYQKRIEEARKLFRFEPAIYEPFYAVIFGVSELNAKYDYSTKSVLINEGLIVDFSLEELSAVIAHEFAHAEFVEGKGRGVETRKHWQVDVRAAELTNPAWVEAYLLRFDKDLYERYDKPVEWLRSNKILFPLSHYFVSQEYDRMKKEINERLDQVRLAKGQLKNPLVPNVEPELRIKIAR